MFLYKHFIAGSETSELDDVIRNLGFVLRTKRGCGYFIPQFGLSDVGYRTPEELVTSLRAEIAENVRLFEPRVQLLDVDEVYDDDGKRVRLVVNMKLREGSDRLRLVIDLRNNSFDIQPDTEARSDGD